MSGFTTLCCPVLLLLLVAGASTGGKQLRSNDGFARNASSSRPGVFLHEFNAPASSEIVSVAEDGYAMPLGHQAQAMDSCTQFVDILDPAPPTSTSLQTTVVVLYDPAYIGLAPMAVNTHGHIASYVAVNAARGLMRFRSEPMCLTSS